MSMSDSGKAAMGDDAFVIDYSEVNVPSTAF